MDSAVGQGQSNNDFLSKCWNKAIVFGHADMVRLVKLVDMVGSHHGCLVDILKEVLICVGFQENRLLV